MSAEPRYVSPSTPSRTNLLGELELVANAFHQQLNPYQVRVFELITEQLPDADTLAFDEVTVLSPRQVGKTFGDFLYMVHRAITRDEQRIAYVTTTGSAGHALFASEWIPQLEQSEFAGLFTYKLSNGAEEIRFTDTGSIVSLLSSSLHAGHGEHYDLIVADEIWHYKDDRLDQLKPTLVTRQSSQLFTNSTAGTFADSPYMLGRRDRGRADVAAGRTTGHAYMEWSIDEADIGNVDAYIAINPSLGYTTTAEKIRTTVDGMEKSEAARAFGDIFVVSMNDPVWDLDRWVRALQDDTSTIDGRVFFGIDVSPNRSHASISCAGKSTIPGKAHVGVVATTDNPAEIPAYLQKLGKEAQPFAIYVDALSAPLLPDLARLGINNVKIINTSEHAAAFAYMAQCVNDGSLVHPSDDELLEALRNAGVRNIGDGGQSFSRRNSNADIDILISAMLALFAYHQDPGPVGVWSLYDLQKLVWAKWEREGIPEKVRRDQVTMANLTPNFDMRPKSEERRSREREVTFHRC
jgi:phage terminase large subunit-like protein